MLSFCTDCGSPRTAEARFCAQCGRDFVGVQEPNRSQPVSTFTATRPQPSKFCTACGRALLASAAVCTSCGSSTGGDFLKSPQAKDRTVSVLLAVFLGHWTWLYTFDRDQQKFWIGLGMWIGGLVLSVFLIGIPILIGLWIWSIVDVVSKTNEWYDRFPKG